MATKSIRVRATDDCFINGHRRRKGAEFFVPANQFSKRYLEKVGTEKPEVTDGEVAARAIDDMTVKELKAELAKKNISAPPSAKKLALAELLKGSEGLSTEDGNGDGDEGSDADNDNGGNDDLT